jgi:hypothetical protein
MFRLGKATTLLGTEVKIGSTTETVKIGDVTLVTSDISKTGNGVIREIDTVLVTSFSGKPAPASAANAFDNAAGMEMIRLEPGSLQGTDYESTGIDG